jgi:predicted nucleic acid-binding protein
MACRRKRISLDQVDGFLTRLKALPIEAAQQTPSEILELPTLAQAHGLTNYDAAYLALALRFKLPLAGLSQLRTFFGFCALIFIVKQCVFTVAL